jgi:hypothetical protein
MANGQWPMAKTDNMGYMFEIYVYVVWAISIYTAESCGSSNAQKIMVCKNSS